MHIGLLERSVFLPVSQREVMACLSQQLFVTPRADFRGSSSRSERELTGLTLNEVSSSVTECFALGSKPASLLTSFQSDQHDFVVLCRLVKCTVI